MKSDDNGINNLSGAGRATDVTSSECPSVHEEENFLPQAGDPLRKIRLIIGVPVLVGILVCIGFIPRVIKGRSAEALSPNSSNGLTSVTAWKVKASEDGILQLPGNIEAIDQTSIVARASGYVRKWCVDIGGHVKTGQTLAIIETPDLDQQVAQARAQLVTAQADETQMLANLSSLRAKVVGGRSNVARAQAALTESRSGLERAKVGVAHGQEAVARQQAQEDKAVSEYNLAKVTSDRYRAMLSDGAVDRESADQAAAACESSKANLAAIQASLRAAKEDVRADREAVLSAQANVSAYESALKSAQADVVSDQANVSSGQAEISAAAANIRSSLANVNRLAVLQSFHRVTAPFDGVITARNIDTGTLITATGGIEGGTSGVGSSIAGASSRGNAANGSSLGGAGSSGGGGASSLYSIARIDRLRVYINVPQTYVDAVKVGQTVDIAISSLSGKSFVGRVVRNAHALDSVSRTLVTEVSLENPKGQLLPGMFAQVKIHTPHQAGSVLIPDAALVTNAGGTQVQLIDSNGIIHYRPVSVGQDFGKVMEITSGLNPSERIVAAVNDSLQEGQHVKISSDINIPFSSS